ncbi:MAG: hypothetical protein WCJ51_00445 [Candidatus Moraniibacteriota bacterium]
MDKIAMFFVFRLGSWEPHNKDIVFFYPVVSFVDGFAMFFVVGKVAFAAQIICGQMIIVVEFNYV